MLSAGLSLLALMLGVWWSASDEALLALQMQATQHANHLQTIARLQADTQQAKQAQQVLTQGVQAQANGQSSNLQDALNEVQDMARGWGMQGIELAVSHTSTDAVHMVVNGPARDVWAWWQQVQASFAWEVLRWRLHNTPQQAQLQAEVRWAGAGEAHLSQVTPSPPPNAIETARAVGFDHAAWLQWQSQQALQSPSYVQWVAPHRQRRSETLEQFALHELRYEGLLSQGKNRVAAVRVLKPNAGVPVLQTVAVGAYLGPDLGRVQAITPSHVLLREVARDAQGEWSPRWVQLPLGQTLQAPALQVLPSQAPALQAPAPQKSKP